MAWRFHSSIQTNGEDVRNPDFIIPSITLSFPPDPFQWASLPMAKVPFSDDIIFVVLEKLRNADFIQDLVRDLKHLFKVLLLHACTCVRAPSAICK